MDVYNEDEVFVVALLEILDEIRMILMLFNELYESVKRRRLTCGHTVRTPYSLKSRLPGQISSLRKLVGTNDVKCHNNLRMNIDTFNRLCYVLEQVGGLQPTRNMLVPEQVAIFLHILAHHTKNVVVQTNLERSGYTVSKYFGKVMKAVLKLHSLFLVDPEPVPADCDDYRWKYFTDCLGALDGTYIQARVPKLEKPRYRNRKGDISVNVLAVCDRNLNFVYVLTGWEGSAADSRILRDAITRQNGLKVPTGHYYLVDNGYTNGDGFLSPYRNTRYHLHDYGVGRSAPQNYKEYFNMRHSKARNVIERTFGILKSRWGILRSCSYYPIKMQNRIIMACCLLHNFIRTNSDHDPEEVSVPQNDERNINENCDDFINNVESTPEWAVLRDNMAMSMYNEWNGSR